MECYNPSDWNYVALGDLHDWHAVSTREYYAGSTSYCSSNIWGETKPKGWLLVTLTEGNPEVEFHPIPQRRWVTVTVDPNTEPDELIRQFSKEMFRAVRLQEGSYRQDRPVVRLILEGRDGHERAERCFQQAWRDGKLPVQYLYIQRKVVRPAVSHELAKIPLEERWRRFVLQQFSQDPLKDITAEQIIARGLEALESVKEV